MQIDYKKNYRTRAKSGQRGREGEAVTGPTFGILGPLYRELLKLETSNLASRLITRTIEKMQNYVKGDTSTGSRDPLLECLDPSVSREWLKLETSNLVYADAK